LKISKLLYSDVPKFLSAIKAFKQKKTVKFGKIKFNLITDNWITKYRARTFATKEPELLNWIDTELHSKDNFFDIGSNIGIYSIYPALRNKGANIYSFEPEYANLNLIKNNIIINSLSKKINLYSFAFGEKDEISKLHIQDFTPGSALHTVEKKNISKTKTGKKIIWNEGIFVITLDRFVKETGIIPNLIKIDVDGNELNVLKGGKITLKNKKLRSILIEMDSKKDRNKIIKILKLSGFRLSLKAQYNEIWRRA
tara:strand:- start:878 stop:1639 length:762 start_codon:yes stop_codon:yes gene_type:complete